MRPHLSIHTLVAPLALAAGTAFAARVDTGDLLYLAQPPYSNILVIGSLGQGSVTIDGGTQAYEDAIALGGLAGADGALVVTGAGSKLTTTGDPTTRASVIGVGIMGAGTVDVTGGAVVEVDGTDNQPGDQAAGFGVAVEVGSTGAVTVSGTGSMLLVRNGAASTSGLAVGLEGGGSLDIEAGGVVRIDTGTGENSGVTVGSGRAATGSLAVTGAASALQIVGTGTGLTVGNEGPGTLVLDDGASAGAQAGFVGLAGSGEGTIEVRDGATLALSGTNPLLGFGGSLAVGLAGSGTLDVSNGRVVLENQDGIVHGLVVGGATGCGGPCPFTGGSGTVTLDGPGAALRIAGPRGGATIGADGEGSLTVEGGAALVVEDQVGGGVIVAGSAGSSGTVVVRGAGSSLDAGSALLLGLDLALADAGAAHAAVLDRGAIEAGSVLIGTAGRLDGDGIVAAPVENLRGTIAPGASRGTLAVRGGLTQGGGRLRIELGGVAPEPSDRLDVGGPLALSGGSIHFDLVDGYLPAAGDEITIASAAGGVSLDPAVVTSYAGAAPGFSFEVVPQGNELLFRALSDARGLGACQVSHLKAFSTLCRRVFSCQAGFVKKGDAAKRDGCVAAGEAKFAKAYDTALQKAARRGTTCGLQGPAAEADDAITGPGAALSAEILLGWNPDAGKDDDALRAALLRKAGTLCGALLGIEGKQARKRDVARRNAARAKARGTFEVKASKAFAKAAKKGVVYMGPGAPEIGEAMQALAGAATGASAGIAP